MRRRDRFRRIFVYALYILITGIVQFQWPESWGAWGVKPDFMLVLTVLAGYLYGFVDGAVVGLIAGFVRDCLGSRVFGSGMLMLFLAGVLAASLFQRNMNRTAITVFLSIITITLLLDVTIFVIQYLMVRSADMRMWAFSVKAYAGKRLLPLELFNLFCGLLTLPIFKNLGPYPKRVQRDRLTQGVRGEELL